MSAGRLVLVVEDIAVNLMLTEAVLAGAGYQVISAVTAADALERLGEQRPDAILMDIQLPGEDGLSLTRRLKADPATAGIPVIALTAHAMKGDAEEAAAAGCDAYISKPINTRTLAAQIAAVIDRLGGGD